jgi:hypothetical protein
MVTSLLCGKDNLFPIGEFSIWLFYVTLGVSLLGPGAQPGAEARGSTHGPPAEIDTPAQKAEAR